MLIHKSKRLLIISLILFAVVVSLGIGYLYNSGSFDSEEDTAQSNLLIEDGPCSLKQQGSLLSESASAFLVQPVTEETSTEAVAIERAEKLFALEEKIINEDNYEKDANCLHTLTMLYINRSDITNSEKHLVLLKDGLDESNPESYILDENVNFRSLEDMRNSIDILMENAELRNDNDLFKDNELFIPQDVLDNEAS